MEENSDSNDINVGSIGNSIEKDIKIINNFITYFNKNIQNGNKADLTVLGEEINAIEHILSDYKRVLKENEILKEEKEQAWEEWNNLEQGSYGTEQKLKQQIKELKKENEELKNNTRKNENELEFDIDCDWIALQKMLDESEKSNEYISYKNEKWIKEKYCIPVQKIKDKIEELNRKIDKSIDNSKGGLDEEFIEKAGELLTQKRILQELLEGGQS